MIASLAAYVVVFTCLAFPWLRHFGWALPLSVFGWVSDMRLIVWILSWVNHALMTDPTRLFDAPINWPAPGQLTGCEHFASSQVLFAPVFWATGNGVLAANWTALASYPLAALAMERLVRRLGCGGPAAWLSGLIFALGPLRVPANLQVLQYANLYLPLLYIAVIHLREHPDAARSALLALVLGMGVFSSYYMAVMLAVVGTFFGLLELRRTGTGRLRFALLAVAVAIVCLALLLAFSRPYFRRPETSNLLAEAAAKSGIAVTVLWPSLPDWSGLFGGVSLLLAALGLLTLRGGFAPTGRVARIGLLFAAVGGILALGPDLHVHGWHVPLPFALIAGSGALFFRAPVRFIVVAGFGEALLGAAAFDRVTRALGKPMRAGLLAAVVGAVVLTRGPVFNGTSLQAIASPDATTLFADIGKLIRDFGDGPLLELPALDSPGVRDSEAMMHATWHWAPLVAGYTGYSAAHRAFLERTVRRFPSPEALTDLVDATHVRWLLLKPAKNWKPDAREGLLRSLAVSRLIGGMWEMGGWTLVRIMHEPAHPAWYLAIANGYQPGHTVLGTKTVPLPSDAAVARISVEAPPTVVWGHSLLRLKLSVENSGTATWAVAVPRFAPTDYTVQLVARWRSAAGGDDRGLPRPQEIALPRDVDPAETVSVEADLATPTAPGVYDLDIRADQVSGSDFTNTRNVPLHLRISVLQPPGWVSAPK